MPADRRFVRQAHTWSLEVQCLADGSCEKLCAGRAREQAAGDADAELIRIADPISPDVAIVAVQLHQIQIGHGRVEHGQRRLIAIGCVQVQQPRLERNAPLTARVGRALKGEPGVEHRERQRALG